MARRNSNILLRVTGDTADAKAALRDIRQDLRRMSREEARIRLDVQTERVKRQIAGVRNELEALSRKEASPRVELQTQRASERLRLLELRLDRLGLKRVQIDVDVKRGALERTAAGIGAVDRGIQGVARGFAGIFEQVPLIGGLLTGALSGAFSIASSLGQALGGLVTRGITDAGAVVLPTRRAGGADRLGRRLGRQPRRVAGRTRRRGRDRDRAQRADRSDRRARRRTGRAGRIARCRHRRLRSARGRLRGDPDPDADRRHRPVPALRGVIKARQAREQELAQAVQQQKTAEEQRKAALESVRQAEQRLADTTVAARKRDGAGGHRRAARRTRPRSGPQRRPERPPVVLQARKDLKDLLAQTGVTGRGLERLFKQFSDVHVDPTKLQGVLGGVQQAGGDTSKVDPLQIAQAIQNVRNAELGVKQAVEGVGDAHRTALEAERKRTDFARRGLRAYQPYRQALQQVANAETRLAKRRTRRPQPRPSTSTRCTVSPTPRRAPSAASTDSSRASPTSPRRSRTRSSRRSTTPSIRSRGRALSSRVRSTEIGKAFGDVIRAIGGFLREPATQNGLQDARRWCRRPRQNPRRERSRRSCGSCARSPSRRCRPCVRRRP
jgi:hypothetical protein